MKRSKPLRRKTELRADPEKAREFEQRGRGQLGSDPEKTAAFVQRGRESGARSLRESAVAGLRTRREVRAAEGPLDPATWRKCVHDASAGRCIITGTRADGHDDPHFEAHHPLPKRELRARGLHGHVWDARNGVWLVERVHERHESGTARIPRERLPVAVWEFAAEMDALGDGEWATAMIERLHPAAGSSGRTTPRRS